MDGWNAARAEVNALREKIRRASSHLRDADERCKEFGGTDNTETDKYSLGKHWAADYIGFAVTRAVLALAEEKCGCAPDGPFCGACAYDEDGELTGVRVHTL